MFNIVKTMATYFVHNSSSSGNRGFMYSLMFSYIQSAQYKTEGNYFLFSVTQNNQL